MANPLILFAENSSFAFLTPLSTSLKELGIYKPIGVEMALPTEPLLFGLMIVAWVKMFSDKALFKGLYTHPISISIGALCLYIIANFFLLIFYNY